jgi:two-component system, OmpR family, KDP operon response regulator KdpE
MVIPRDTSPLVEDRLRGAFDVHVLSADDAGEALHAVGADLCMIDVSRLDFVDLVRDLARRAAWPVLAVGQHAASSLEALRFIEAGADDYLSVTSANGEWAARVRAVMRRGHHSVDSPDEPEHRIGDLTISLSHRLVRRGGQPVKLTHTEFNLLEILAQHIDRPVPYRKLMADVWGVEHLSSRHYLRVYVRRLREKLESDPANPQLITTEWGAGYMLRSAKRD